MKGRHCIKMWEVRCLGTLRGRSVRVDVAHVGHEAIDGHGGRKRHAAIIITLLRRAEGGNPVHICDGASQNRMDTFCVGNQCREA